MLEQISNLGMLLSKQQQTQIKGGYGSGCKRHCEWTERCGCVCPWDDIDGDCY